MPSVKAHKHNLQRLTDTIWERVQCASNRRDNVWSLCVSTSQGEEVCTGEASCGVMSEETVESTSLLVGIFGKLLRSICWFL